MTLSALAGGTQVDWVAQDRARQLRDEGMQSAVDHADRVTPTWSTLAYTSLCEFIATQKPRFTTEDVRDWAKLEEPPDRRAWGAVMMRAVRAGLIYKVGYRPHRDPARHKGISTVWGVK